MAHITAAPQRRNIALWSLVLLGVGLFSILPLMLINPAFGPGSSAPASPFDRVRIAYFEFSTRSDTLWAADPASPRDRIKLLTIDHAPDYGVVPALSPDSRWAAYTVLPPSTPAPAPDAPAQLWVAPLTGGGLRLLASNVDLLVPPAWSPDGKTIIVRRSASESTSLIAVPISGGAERTLTESSEALFPAGFSPDGARFIYAGLSNEGSFVYQVDMTSGADSVIGKLSEGLTRDWALSPDGTRLAFLEMTFSAAEVASRAIVIDLRTRERTRAGSADANAFSPAWDEHGRLIVGQLREGALSTAASVGGADAGSTLRAPARGFDVPLASSVAGVAVTSFDGTSISNAGRASLVVVDPAGVRREIATGEVTFLGWIIP